MPKTNAVRILESNNISFEIVCYFVDENDLSGITVAKKIAADPEKVFKTLIASGDKNGINVFCIPVNAELNLKKAANVSKNKKIEMIKIKDLFELTGYVRGGCSPIGMKKKFPSFIEETAQLFEKIFISAGIRGMQISISPQDLITVTLAEYADLI